MDVERIRRERGEVGIVAAQLVTDSLKAAVMKRVALEGPFATVADLVTAIRATGHHSVADVHNVTHVLHSLSKQGKVKFTMSTRQASSNATAHLKNITATAQGRKAAGVADVDPLPLETTTMARPPGWSRAKHAVGKDMTQPGRHGPVASGGPVLRMASVSRPQMSVGDLVAVVEAPAPPAEAPRQDEPAPPATGAVDLNEFPLLRELLARFATNAEADAKASKYADAAAALEQVDPKRSEELLALAMEVGGKPFSTLEREYLRFAEVAKGLPSGPAGE
jgi:hypothetical protein